MYQLVDNSPEWENCDLECKLCHVKFKDATFPKDSHILAWANISKNNTFTYGLSGSFKITSNILLEEGDHVCNQCLINLKYEPHLNIECSVCHKYYQSIYDDKSGIGCAAWIHDKSISGGYGSSYDSFSEREQVTFAIERPEHMKYGELICDTCISNLIQKGICMNPECYSDSYSDSVTVNSILPNNENLKLET
jgi:hypothetical protein